MYIFSLEFTESIEFTFIINNIIDYLIELVINIIIKCKINDREFFSNLEVIYNYLNRLENVIIINEYLLSRYEDKFL